MSRRCLGCMELFGDEFEICPHCGYIVGTPAEEAIHMEPGTLLHDRYIIGRVLGYGGFGVTYLGWDGKLEQKVAIKEYLPGEFSTRMPGQSRVTVFYGEKSEQFHDGLKKFVEEAKHLAKFQNEPGIVKIFDSFEENETAYIIMEYLEGETLTSYLKREKTIPEDQAVAMMMPVMESLQTVHAEGLLHRDIAPDNIFLLKSGEVKLIDFGASRYATTSHSRSLTVIIKPGYSPEEQYRSRGDQGPHTDVYALGATLYKMITGKTPPDAMERRAKYENQSKDILEPPRRIDKRISATREVAILNAMNVRIEDRTPDVGELISELNAASPARRRSGKIKRIDLYSWPRWLKITIPSLLVCLGAFITLMLTGVIEFSLFSEEVVIPDGIVTVPDVEGMKNDEAIKEIESGQLNAATQGTVESEYITAGTIVLQTPTGGSYIGKNETVFLTVSSGSEIQEAENGIATVPYVIWDTKEKALSKLRLAGLGEPEIEEMYDENVSQGQVISQSVSAGTEVDEGTVITLMISKGAEAFDIPGVERKGIEEAMSLLESKGLIVSVEYKKDNSVATGSVISQSIAPGSKVRRGDKITLVVSSGKKTAEVANVAGMMADSAEATLKKQGFKVTRLENYDSHVAEGCVISQSPEAGSSQVNGAVITLYVSKGKQPVTVSFSGAGGSAGADSITVYFGDNYGELPTATKGGYEFEGWFTDPDEGTRITSQSMVTTSSSHILYAHWRAAVYTVSFDAGYGSVSKSSMTVTFGGSYGELPTATRTGYSFVGWYTAASGGTQIGSSTTVSTSSDHVLYAHWTEKAYELHFDTNGGTMLTSGSSRYVVYYNSALGALPTPTRDYYNFDGWYTAASGGTKVSSQTKMEASDLNLYAHWSLKSESGWVRESTVPAGAKITNQKWTYTRTETTESSNSSMSGWTQTGSYWKQTGSGSTKYASFPSGFDTGNWIYTSYAKSPYSEYENTNSKRVVSNNWSGYIYWHWMYSVQYASGTTRMISPKKGTFDKYGNSGSGYWFGYFYAFESGTNYPALDKYYCCSQNIMGYNCHNAVSSWAGHSTNDGVGTDRFFRFDYYTSSYTDYSRVYTFKKVTTGLESSSEVKNGGSISDVQKYVKYREK